MFKNTKNKTFESWIAVFYLNVFALLMQLIYFLYSKFLFLQMIGPSNFKF